MANINRLGTVETHPHTPTYTASELCKCHEVQVDLDGGSPP